VIAAILADDGGRAPDDVLGHGKATFFGGGKESAQEALLVHRLFSYLVVSVE
jgi:hypothetical protein